MSAPQYNRAFTAHSLVTMSSAPQETLVQSEDAQHSCTPQLPVHTSLVHQDHVHSHTPDTDSIEINHMDKAFEKEIRVMVEPVSDQGEVVDAEATTVKRHWRPGFWSQFPWAGFVGLCTVIMCSIATLITLKTADNKAASVWAKGRIAPNVLINIFNSLSNLALAMAVGQGIAISWWRRALTGQSVKELHYAWSFSTGISNIVKKFRYFNMIALAALMTKIAVLDGILYQKAISTYLDVMEDDSHIETLQAFGAKVFPVTAKMGPNPSEHGLMTWDFEYNVINWDETRDDVDAWSYVNCLGQDCHYHLPSAGFAMTCDTEFEIIDYGALAQQRNTSNATDFTDIPIFGVNFSRTWPTTEKNYSAILLNMSFPEQPSEGTEGVCPMNLTRVTCELRPALVNYTLIYTNGYSAALSSTLKLESILSPGTQADRMMEETENGMISAINSAPSGVLMDHDCPINSTSNDYDFGCGYYDYDSKQLLGFSVLETVDIYEPFVAGGDSRLEGFYLAFQNLLEASGRLSLVNDTWHIDEEGMSAISTRYPNPPPGYCNFTFSDPTKLVLGNINTLMRMSTGNVELYWNTSAMSLVNYTETIMLGDVKPEDASLVNVTAVVHYKDVFYYTNDRFMYAALGSTLFVVLCTIPVFWGFWELGRRVTLGPFEIANAFGSPAFDGVAGHHVDEVIASVGRRKVVYGNVEHETGQRLGFTVA